MTPTPALDAWRKAGDVATRDDLWLAACEEASALELKAIGCTQNAARALARARELWPGPAPDRVAARSGSARPIAPAPSLAGRYRREARP